MNKFICLLFLSTSALKAEESKYWEEQYIAHSLTHHSSQNVSISQDFIRNIKTKDHKRSVFHEALTKSSSLLEVGCGSGEMLSLLGNTFKELTMVGVDISHTGIAYAKKHNKNPRISFSQFDCLNRTITEELGRYSIAICSNTLEHFKRPFVLLDAILEACPLCIILVPYNQPVTDGYEMEGGAGHVYTFTEHSFKDYSVLSWFTFQTAGWAYSVCGEQPLQLAVLVAKK